MIELGRTGLKPQHIAGKFYHCALHAQANTKKRNLVFTHIPNGFNFALQSALAESRRHEYTVKVAQDMLFTDSLVTSSDEIHSHIYFAVIFCAGMNKCFCN